MMRREFRIFRFLARISPVLVVAAATLGFSVTARADHPPDAQTTQSSNGIPVQMVVTAEAMHGVSPPPINREEVMVYEGHERDAVTGWTPTQADHSELELFVLIDDSASTSLGSQLDDIRQFIITQAASTKVGVAYMEDGVARIVENPTTDHDEVSKAVRLPLGIAGVNASPYFSLGDLIKRWPASNARREILMVSDGIDRFWGSGPADPYVDSAIAQAQRAGILVYAIYAPGVGHYGHSFWRIWWGQNYLSQVAEETGGESYYIGFYGPAVSYVPYLASLTQRLSNQYLLRFLAKPEKKPGLQKVKVVTEVSNAELVSADKVYVPAETQ